MFKILWIHDLFHRTIPEGTGYVLDGFPNNYNQAKVLEKALTGFNDPDKDDSKDKKTKKSNLVPDPRPAPPVPDPPSGIDVVILFDVENELALKRAAGRYCKYCYSLVKVLVILQFV